MIQIGVIGAGKNAAGNSRRFMAHSSRCRIAAIADVDSAMAAELAAEHEAKAFTDYHDFLDEVDAVIISTPNFLHAEQAIDCAEAGKHIWCEKPVGIDAEQARAIRGAVRKAGVKSMVGVSVRFHPTIALMKQYLDSGKLGAPLSAWSRRLCCFSPGRGKSWRFDYSKSGGVISELMIHEIDWVLHLMGFPETVYCQKRARENSDGRENDHVWLSLQYANGAVGSLECSQMSPMPEYNRGLSGEEGTVFTDRWGTKAFYQKPGVNEPEELPLAEPVDKFAHFLDVIEGKAESVADASWGAGLAEFSALAIDSARANRALELKGAVHS